MKEEAEYLPDDVAVLVTGIGKVSAASSLAAVLSANPLPSEVINLGTAGAVRPCWAGVHTVSRVLQHDFDTDTLRAITGELYGAPLRLNSAGPVLATGDTFISDESARSRIAERADLVDMEGYAVAAVATQFGGPVRLVKGVSDAAGEGAARTWRESVSECAQVLAGWVAREVKANERKPSLLRTQRAVTAG
jgi:adenosylhomocysteine nucleosidase